MVVKDNINANQSGYQVLVAYYTKEDQFEIDDAMLLKHLRSILPDYMVPGFLMCLESFPLTTNGKLDKSALPQISIDGTGYVPPSTEIENKICQIWQGALGIDQVGVTDSFLQLGGNSILAIDVVMRMKQLLGADFSAVDLVKGKTIQALLSEFKKSVNDVSMLCNQVQESDLHHFEKSIYNHALAMGNSLIYNESFTVEYVERVEFKAFKEAVNYLMAKYEVLHSNYYQDEQQGKLHRRLNPNYPVKCEHIKLSKDNTLETFCQQIEQRTFDIEKDKLIRFYLIDAQSKQYIFVSFWHVLLDATSMINIILPDLYLCLHEGRKTLVKQTMADFCGLSAAISCFYHQDVQQKIAFWKQKISVCEELSLGAAKPEGDLKGQQISCQWNDKIRSTVKRVANALKISEYSVLYGLFTVMLGKLTQQSRFAVLTNVDERIYAPQYQFVSGCFINNVLIDGEIIETQLLKNHLISTHQQVVESIEHALPYEQLMALDRERVLQLSDVQFNLQPEEVLHYPYLQTQNNSHSGYVKHGLYFELDLKQEQILCRVEFDLSIYQVDEITALLDNYQALLSASEKMLESQIAAINLPKPTQIYNPLTDHYLGLSQKLGSAYVAPSSKIEKDCCDIWQSILNIKRVGIQDDFFKLGGNSILAIMAAHRISKVANSKVTVADIFRLKTIANIIHDCTSNTTEKNLKTLSQTTASQHVFCFIHPAFAGCEVYQALVDKLSTAYLCVGIENYNFEHNNKITILSELAQQYLCYLRLNSDVNNAHRLTLVGWSLGGLIALEMAYWLEQQERTNVRLILMDSHIPYGRVLKYHPHFNPEKGGQNIDEFIKEKIATLEPGYAQKVLANKDYDIAIGQTQPTGKLKQTRTILLKANNQFGYRIKDNNVSKYVKSLKRVKIAANHMNIIEEVNKNWLKYESLFICNDTKFKNKVPRWLRDLLNTIKENAFSLIFVLGAVAFAAYLIGADEYLISTV